MLIVPEYRYCKQKIQMLLQEASYLRVFVIKIYIQICDHSIWDDYDQALYSFTYFNLQVAIWWSDFCPFFPLEMIRIGLMFHYIDHLLKVRPIFICAHFLIVQYGRNEATKSQLVNYCLQTVNKLILCFQRVLESDIRVGSYSYDVKKEKWCEVSLKVSSAVVYLTRPAQCKHMGLYEI